MTDEKLEKAMDLKDSMKTLRHLRSAFTALYPNVHFRDSGDDFTVSVSFYALDKSTQEGLKKLIIDYIDKRFEEVKKEYDEL